MTESDIGAPVEGGSTAKAPAATQIILIQYQHKFEDIKHSLAAHAEAAMRVEGHLRWKGLVGWNARVALIIPLQLITHNLNLPIAAYVLMAYGTAILMFECIFHAWSHQRKKETIWPLEQFVQPTSGKGQAIDWAARLGGPILVLLLVIFLNRKLSSPGLAAYPGRFWFLQITPWVVVAGVLAWIAYQDFMISRAPKRVWARTREFLSPYRLEANDAGIAMDDVRTRVEYRWLAFDHFVETPEMFLVYEAMHDFRMIPKRGFANSSDMDAFRDLLRTRIRQKTFGFPVAAT